MNFWRLVKANLLMLFRNKSGAFWTLVMPAGIYIALSVLPIGKVLGNANYSSFILPGIIALTIMQSGIYTLAYWVTDMRNRGIIRQLSVTPVKTSHFILSLLAARSVVMVLQAAFLSLIGILFFHITIHGSFFWILVVVVLGGFVFLPVGLLISTFARNYDAAAPLTAGIGLPLTFLGNVFYPVEFLPGYLRVVAQYLPITFLADALRKLYLGVPKFADLSRDLVFLIIWAVIIFLLTLWRFKLED